MRPIRPFWTTPQKGYLFHALGMLHYRCYPEDWTYERLGPDGMIALIFWGIIAMEPMTQGL